MDRRDHLQLAPLSQFLAGKTDSETAIHPSGEQELRLLPAQFVQKRNLLPISKLSLYKTLQANK